MKRLYKSVIFSLSLCLFLSMSVQAADKIGGRWILKNHFNEVVTDQHFTGKFRLIFFGYTFCPDICPTALSNVAEAMDLLTDLDVDIQPLFVSVDPKRDTPEVLREYVSNFHPKIIGLTGTPELIKRTADLFKVKYSIVKSDDPKDDFYTIDHSAGIYFMSPNGYFITKFPHGFSGESIARSIRKILKENK